jgi:DNA-binding NtrC family response regulator
MAELRVLLVDDEEEFLGPLAERLALRDMAVTTASSGAESLECLAREPVDVVVLDVSMTGMDGVETLDHIKRRFPHLEVIMLSGHADTRTAILGMEKGAFDYLVKPVRIDELVYRIQDAQRARALSESIVSKRDDAGNPRRQPE